MNAEDLFVELRKLNRVDKLRAMELLVLELAAEEQAHLIPGKEYEIWSPYNSEDAAATLLKMLKADRQRNDAG
jgi:hypothetical protein